MSEEKTSIPAGRDPLMVYVKMLGQAQGLVKCCEAIKEEKTPEGVNEKAEKARNIAAAMRENLLDVAEAMGDPTAEGGAGAYMPGLNDESFKAFRKSQKWVY